MNQTDHKSSRPSSASPRHSRRMLARWLPVLAAALVAVGSLVAAPRSAAAMGTDQIIQMSDSGLGSGSIIGAIENADEDVEVTPEDIGEMRAAGVSSEVITYLQENGYVADAEGGGEDGDQTDQSGTKQTEGDSSEGDGPAPSDGQDAEDDSSGPAPAVDPDDQEGPQSEEEIEEEVTERMKRRDRSEKYAQKRKGIARRFSRAFRRLDEGQNMQAAQTFLAYLDVKWEFDDKKQEWIGSDNWYEAKFGLARALFKENIYSGAAAPTREVVMAGANREHFKQAFRMLETLTDEIGYQPPELEEMTKLVVDDLNKPFRNNFNYYLGKFFFDYNRNDLAIQYFDNVEEGAEDYPKALYLKGVAQLDPSVDDRPAALKNFERAIIAGEQQDEVNEDILQLGYLALARVFYEVGAYNIALYYYQKVPRDSTRHATALFEKAWTYFVKNDFKKALGTFHTLHSPYYDQWYFPDLYILESTVYLNLCQVNKARRALTEFQEKYLDKRPRLQKYISETNKPEAYWELMRRAGNEKEIPIPKMFANAVMDDLSFYNMYEEVRNLRKEKRALKQNIDALGNFGQQVLDRVSEQLETKVQEGGILVRDKLQEVDDELGEFETDATQISFDIDKMEAQEIEQRLQGQQTEEAQEQDTTLLIVADDWTPWPFEGEYWFDEVSNYRSRQSSWCPEDQ